MFFIPFNPSPNSVLRTWDKFLNGLGFGRREDIRLLPSFLLLTVDDDLSNINSKSRGVLLIIRAADTFFRSKFSNETSSS